MNEEDEQRCAFHHQVEIVQPHAVWNIEPRFAVSVGVVANEHDGLIVASSSLSRKSFEQRRKERLRHAVVHIPKCFAARWRDEGGHLKPIETMVARRDQTLADRCPYAPRHQL